MAQEEGSSSVTSSPFQLFSWIPGIGSPYPLLREMNSEERGLNLINLIITCTNYVAANSTEADVGLDYISNLASPDGEPMQRIAAYFNEALASRMLKGRPGLHRALYSTRIASVNEDILVRKLFFELCPFLKLAYVITNQAIVEAMEEEKMVHIIDLHSFEPAQWINLLQTFSGRPGGPPHLRITGIHEQREVLIQMSQLLTDEAEKLDIPFQFNPVVSKLEDIELENLPLKMGEALAVSSVLQLHTLLATDDMQRNSPSASRPLTSSQLQKALHLDRRTLGEWLQTDSVSIFSPSPDSMSSSLSTLSLTSSPKVESFLRGLKPKLVVVTEQESDHNGNSLMERVMRALNFYATLFDCLESTMSRESMERRMLEKKLFGEEIKNIIACEEAIEFWSSICDEEIDRLEYETPETGDSVPPNSHFIEKARASLVPMLLETLLKQEEDQDQDDSIWNISMAGGTCLGLVARTVGDEIVPLVMPFVEGNIVKSDWRCREAATYAFGSILEGPTIDKLAPLVHAGLDFLLNAMKDENNHVKDTTAWTLSRIFELLHCPGTGFSVITPENLQRVLTVVLEGIKDAPNVAEKVCGAIYYLAQGYEDAGPTSSLLSPYLTTIIAELLKTADRTDGGDSKLRSSAYETLNEVIRCSNITETSQIIAELLPAIMGRLGQTLELQIVSSDDREKQGDLQASLCGVLQVIIQKLSSTDDTKSVILQAADQIMVLFLRVFACRSSTVHEEAMLAIGALAYATGPEFDKYMAEFFRYLQMGLQNSEEYQVCAITVGVIGDICRALDEKILPYCDGIMSLLLSDLSSSQLHRSVKPPIFSCFGDIALAIGEHFEKYVPHALQMMQDAAQACARLDINDEELVDYVNQLRRSIFEAYSGILQGFKNTKAEIMLPYAQHLLQFIEIVFRDRQRDESVTRAAVAVMGDLADALGGNTKVLFKECAFAAEFISECLRSDDEQLKETAGWTQGMIGRVMVS